MKTNLVVCFSKPINFQPAVKIPNSSAKRTYSTQIINSPPPDFDKSLFPAENSLKAIIARNARGTGGRSSISGIVATVFGASGYLGKYVVNELGKIGSQVVIPYRGEENAQRHLKILGDLGQIVPLQCDVLDPVSIEEVISRSNVVVNLIGKRWSTWNYSLDAVNNVIPANIARVAKKVGIEKFVHVSALGSDPNSPSEWLRSKYAGEVSVRNEFPEAVIVRPAGVYGHEDRILNRWGGIVANWPIIPLIAGHENRKEAYLSHLDFSQALYRIIISDNEGCTYDLGGPEVTTEELVQNVIDCLQYDDPRTMRIPLNRALQIAKYLQYIRRSPFTEDEVRALTFDISVNQSSNLTLADLELNPASILDLIPRYLKHFKNPFLMMEVGLSHNK